MRNPFWFQIVLMIGSVFAGYLFGLGQSKGKIADLEFDNHILEGENESIWQQLYAMTYGDKSEVKLAEESEYDIELARLLVLEDEIMKRNGFLPAEESSLENSKRNHPSNGNKNEDSYCVACYESSVPCDKCAEDRLRFIANNLTPQIKKNKAAKKNKEIDSALSDRIRKEWNES